MRTCKNDKSVSKVFLDLRVSHVDTKFLQKALRNLLLINENS